MPFDPKNFRNVERIRWLSSGAAARVGEPVRPGAVCSPGRTWYRGASAGETDGHQDQPLELNDPACSKTDGLVNGEWIAGSNAASRSTDPATGLELAKVANLGPVDAAAAISAAEKRLAGLARRPPRSACTILMKWFALLVQHADDLARIMTAEQGKPPPEARGEVIYGASFIEWFAEEGAPRLRRDHPTTDANKRAS